MSINNFPQASDGKCWTTSNVRVVSNVFPVDESHLRQRDLPGGGMVGVYQDKRFRLQLRGKAALKKLARERVNGGNDEHRMRQELIEDGEWQEQKPEVRWIERWQIDLYLNADGNGRCANCPVGARPIGMGWHAGGRTMENRCQKSNCRCR